MNNLPIHKNQSTELLEGEAFRKHKKKDVEVSNLGRIKYDEHILEQYDPKNNGYLYVDVKNKPEIVYRLVAETWLKRPVPNPDKLSDVWLTVQSARYNTVHHISNNGYDNRIENLMWVTKWQHAMIHPWMNITNLNNDDIYNLRYSYEKITITPDDYPQMLEVAKRMLHIEAHQPEQWLDIIELLEDLLRKTKEDNV